MRTANIILACWFTLLMVVIGVALWIDQKVYERHKSIRDFDFGDIEDI